MSSIQNKKILIILSVLLLLAGCGFSRPETKEEIIEETFEVKQDHPQVEAGILTIDRQGNLVLDMSVQQLNEKGYETGDVITVTVNEKSFDMPIGLLVNEAEGQDEICLFVEEDKGEDVVKLVTRNGSFCLKAGIAEVELIDEDPGHKILWSEGIDQSLTVFLNMKDKQGHSYEYPSDENFYKRTNERGDYPHLTDEEYANFREVDTMGIGSGILYRSSSPVNSKISRNLQADEAIRKAGIRTVFNMTDYPEGLKLYDSYEDSYYKDCDIIALNMSTKYHTDEFKERLAEGYRFLISHESPYLIHCTEGKDRTGFAIAILECLMGTEADEIVSDYMKTYYNYYGIKLGTVVYKNIADRNIKKDLARALEIDSIYDVDLSICAYDYLIRIGMSEEEIDLLKEKLQEN
ncbi:MAG: tyrosine-protein phosphatase [Erysipelotrichaceae bacterium]|nr:tyrosine-protein phosphatase [Erysipelotrichaceae bacterium]